MFGAQSHEAAAVFARVARKEGWEGVTHRIWTPTSVVSKRFASSFPFLLFDLYRASVCSSRALFSARSLCRACCRSLL
eukprot:COSAG05_NODE_39_length_27555_cov_750.282925_16_plen_78_part_00